MMRSLRVAGRMYKSLLGRHETTSANIRFVNRASINLLALVKVKIGFLNTVRYTHSNPASISRLQTIIHVIPAAKDNYMYMIIDKETRNTAVVDPIDVQQIAAMLDREKLKLKCVLTTHYLPDHASGNKNIAQMIPKIPIYGGDQRVSCITKIVRNGDLIKAGSLRFKCFLNPEDASGHVIYFLQNQTREEPASAFVGDAMFIGGFGSFSESNQKQVYKALTEGINCLPENTDIFCGHECTIENLNFALTVEPTNLAIKQKLDWALNRRSTRDPTVPATLNEEKKYNPFLRLTIEPRILRSFGVRTPQDALIALRGLWKSWLENKSKRHDTYKKTEHQKQFEILKTPTQPKTTATMSTFATTKPIETCKPSTTTTSNSSASLRTSAAMNPPEIPEESIPGKRARTRSLKKSSKRHPIIKTKEIPPTASPETTKLPPVETVGSFFCPETHKKK